ARALIPNVEKTLLYFGKQKINFRFGMGLAYLTKHFDPLHNPLHNAVGSHWNAGVLLEINALRQLNPHWQIKSGFNLIHYSNGTAKLPNFGYNSFSFMLGLSYLPKAVLLTDYHYYDVPKKRKNKWGAQLWGSLAYSERGVPNGPAYPVYAISLAANYYLHKVNRLYFGMEYEYNKGIYEFGKHTFAFDTEREAKWRASRLQVFVADELLFGDWSVSILLGAYAGNKFYLLPLPIYNKIIMRYYLPFSHKVRIHIGAYLKSHIIIAEYLGFGVGGAF
ncbi:MAG TPA: hypothetical protein ENJ45_00100, partial [Phaeodactylibacter sp.]|nr:hypothetical protein [Phaeodactylibacter sp.]